MYGIVISIGIFAGALLAEQQAKKRGLNTDVLWDSLLIGLIAGLIGARLYHVIDYFEYYKEQPLQMLAIWQGGLGIIGGILLAVPTILLFLKLKKQDPLKWLDIAALSMPLGQAIGRWGNYFNNELIPYAIYESLFSIALFLFLYAASLQTKTKGAVFSLYILGYALIRLLLEDTRADIWTISGVSVAKAVSTTAIIAILFTYAIHRLRSWRLQTKK